MQVSPTSLSFTKANRGDAQAVKVTGLTSERWAVTHTPGITVNPLAGGNNDSFSVTAGPELRAGSPATITVAAPGQPPISVSVSLVA